MKLPWRKLLLFLVPAIGALLFVLWRFSPEQAIIRRAEVVFASVEKKTIESETAREKAERIAGLLHPDFEIEAPRPVPSGPLPRAAAKSFVEDLQFGVTSCRISRSDETVAFPGDREAIYQAILEANIVVAPGSQRILRYRCRLQFLRNGRDWLLRSVVLTAL